MKIILASQSPRRKELLSKLKLKFKVISSNYNESKVSFNNSPEEYCESLAFNKAQVISKKHPNSLVIGADTIVYRKNRIYPKPKNNKIAFNYLKNLSDKTHHVYTGIALIMNNNNQIFHELTKVTFKKLSDNEIHFYINNYNILDKSGAYGIQDWSATFVKKIEGCYYNVVGLPISKIYTVLKIKYPKIFENLLVTNLENQ